MTVSRLEARAILARALFDLPAAVSESNAGPAGGFVIERTLAALRVVQMDPVRRVAQSHHLSLALRAKRYRPRDLETLERTGRVVEVRAHERSLVPIEDLPLYVPGMRLFRDRLAAQALGVADAARDVLVRLDREGPLPSRAFAGGPSARVEGFWDRPGVARTQPTSLALEILWDEGRVTVFREAGTRVYDLPERRWPEATREAAEAMDPEEARRGRLMAYLAAAGLASMRNPRLCLDGSPAQVRAATVDWALASGQVVSLTVAGDAVHAPIPGLLIRRDRLEGTGFDAVAASRGARALRPRSSRPCLLPPLDNLLWQRGLVKNLLDLSYRWEAYVPAARRKIGPYGMPLWDGETLAGQVDVEFDRRSMRLVGRYFAPERSRKADRTRDRRTALGALQDLSRHVARIEGISRPLAVLVMACEASET